MTTYIIISVVIVSLISFVGISAVALGDTEHKGNQHRLLNFLVALAIGALLGDFLIHLWPEVFEEIGGRAAIYTAVGFVGFFLLEKLLHWRHEHKSSGSRIEPIGWMNLIADGIHNFTDGALIAAAYVVSLPIGLATTVAVVLHEIPQEFGDYGILRTAGFTRKTALLFNFLSGIFAVIGALVIIWGGGFAGKEPFILAFTGGGFIYLVVLLFRKLSVEMTASKALTSSLAFSVGILAMWLVGFLE